MNKSVNIRISGIQKELSDEPTVVECIGSFHSDSEQHYIRYTDPDGIKNLADYFGQALLSFLGTVASIA